MSRETFLARVRQAAASGRQYRVHINPFPENAGYCGVREDLVQRFAQEVNLVGGRAQIATNLADAQAKISALLAELRPQNTLVWRHPLLERVQLREQLFQYSGKAFNHDDLLALPPNERRPQALACDFGVTSCDFAIAETGTLLVAAGPGQERMASLLPPVYLTLVERSQIVPDLIDALRLIRARGDLPSNITLITGPSKTGDIELQLTTGVHGPGRWEVIVIDQP
jgi:L-lactate dehydrogenase complex protein LldG